jgi:tetratricopeptide (TPR) repeat protein
MTQETANQETKKTLILSNNAPHRDRDKKTLRELPYLELAGSLPSSGRTWLFLDKTPCDLILLDASLEDMSGLQFLRAIKKKPKFKRIPVVLVTSVSDKNSVLDAISAGCSGYVIRPYPKETLEKHIDTALRLGRFHDIERQQLKDANRMLEKGNFDDAIEEFEDILSNEEQAQKYYDMGCMYLMKQQFGPAIISFQKAIQINDLYAEAYKGLADAYRGKGEMDKCERLLKKSAEIHAQFNRLEKVKELFVEILKLDEEAANPFNALGVKLRKAGDYDGAISAYQQAIELTPEDENVYFNMSKALYFMNNKQGALDNVTKALTFAGKFPEAEKMYKSLTGKNWDRTASTGRKQQALYDPLTKDV